LSFGSIVCAGRAGKLQSTLYRARIVEKQSAAARRINHIQIKSRLGRPSEDDSAAAAAAAKTKATPAPAA